MARYQYDPYGNIVAQSGPEISSVPFSPWGEGMAALQAAGGIGGLLAMSDPNDPNDPVDTWGDFVFCYDGNGNVGN